MKSCPRYFATCFFAMAYWVNFVFLLFLFQLCFYFLEFYHFYQFFKGFFASFDFNFASLLFQHYRTLWFWFKNSALPLIFHYGSSNLQNRPTATFVNLSSFNLLKLLKVLDQKQLYCYYTVTQPSHLVASEACLALHFTTSTRASSGLRILASNKGLTKITKSNKAVLDKKRCWVFNYFNTTN